MIAEILIKPGYLYLLQNQTVGGYKIGITTAPESRFKALAVGTKSRLLAYWHHPHYREIESYFHKHFKLERVPQSEYFDLTDDQVQSVIDEMGTCAEVQYLDPEVTEGFVGSRLRFVKQITEPIQVSKGFALLATSVASAVLVLMSLAQ